MNKCLLILMSALLFLISCSSKEAKKPVVYSEESPKINTTNPKKDDVTAQMLASELGSNLFTEVDFKKGSSDLSGEAKQKLKELYQKAQGQKIEEVQIISWADQEYPQKGGELDSEEKILAEERNEEIENALKGFGADLEVKKISMAQVTEGFEKLTSPTSADVKESMEEVDIATQSAPESGESKATKSIIIFIPE